MMIFLLGRKKRNDGCLIKFRKEIQFGDFAKVGFFNLDI